MHAASFNAVDTVTAFAEEIYHISDGECMLGTICGRQGSTSNDKLYALELSDGNLFCIVIYALYKNWCLFLMGNFQRSDDLRSLMVQRFNGFLCPLH